MSSYQQQTFGTLFIYEPIAEWDGRCLTNDGQTVKGVDAFWIADALETSLKDTGC